MSRTAARLAALEREVISCGRCPRLVAWRERVAVEKRAAYQDQSYWGRPVPGFGDPRAWLLIVGLAPAAHGANRTGRMFTGDRSGEWLYRALFRAGLASRPESTSRDDGLSLRGAYVTAAVRCAPPANKPKPAERDACRPFLERELALLSSVRVIVPLGGFAYSHVLRVLRDLENPVPRPAPRFGHGVEVVIGEGQDAVVAASDATGAKRTKDAEGGSRGGTAHEARRESSDSGGSRLHLVASFHPSQQNTFTGKLTEAMFDAVWRRARELSERDA